VFFDPVTRCFRRNRNNKVGPRSHRHRTIAPRPRRFRQSADRHELFALPGDVADRIGRPPGPAERSLFWQDDDDDDSKRPLGSMMQCCSADEDGATGRARVRERRRPGALAHQRCFCYCRVGQLDCLACCGVRASSSHLTGFPRFGLIWGG
jgi:hypothetical protein